MCICEEGMSTYSSILAWKIPWTEKATGLQSMGLQRVGHDWSDRACMHAVYICAWQCFRFQWPVFSSQHWHKIQDFQQRMHVSGIGLYLSDEGHLSGFFSQDTVWADGTLIRLFGHRFPFIKHILMRHPNSSFILILWITPDWGKVIS